MKESLDRSILYQKKQRKNQILTLLFLLVSFFSVSYFIFDSEDFSVNLTELKIYLIGDGTDLNPGFFSPSAPPEQALEYFYLLIDTVLIAFLASFISIPSGFILSIGMSRNVLDIFFFNLPYLKGFKPIVYYLCLSISNIMRSVNDLIWALILVAAVGLGPLAGVLALGIHSGGVMAKLLAERLEDIDNNVCWHSLLDGCPVINTVYYTVLPQLKSHFVSTILYRFETDIRSATVIGVVGAGGIGMYLKNALENFETQKASLMMIMIIVLIFVIDKASAYFRKKFL